MTPHRNTPEETVHHQTSLVIQAANQTPQTIVLDQTDYTIGRDASTTIHLDYAAVSRRHGRLVWQDDAWHYTDLGSANGSFVNGQRVQQSILTDGDVLHLGSPDTPEAIALTLRTMNAQPEPESSPAATAEDTTLDGTSTGDIHARLIVQIPGQSLSEIVLTQSILTLGRGQENNIILPQPVSRQHGRLEQRGTTWHYIDLGSTNGTLVQGQPVQEAALADGDTLLVGDPQGNWVRLIFRAQKQSAAAAKATRLVSAPTIRLKESAAAAPSGPTSLTIGRNPDSDLPLQSPNVSWSHARIDAQESQQMLVDLKSTNGTFVNGQRITQPHALQKHDVIQIGSFRLVFDGESLQQSDQRGGMRIDVRDMTLVVGKGRRILNDISLTIEPREFVALVGGSGAGKSTLMKAMSGFSRATNGNTSPVLVNGDDYYHNFDAYRPVLGYVPQDDILHRELPVQDALSYAASLRLPADMAPDEVDERIQKSLDDVEMRNHTMTMINALSGGQRKRVSIASEMLADPSLFFLDEPTSGLDPGLEKKMMFTLRRLADSGRTVVLVTHATENIMQCDHVVFLETGHLVYYGPPKEALEFFGVDSGSFADIYTRLKAEPGDDLYNALVQGTLQAEYAQWQREHPDDPGQPPLVELWQAHYQQSEQYQRYVHDRKQTIPTLHMAQDVEQPTPPPRLSRWQQFRILTRRYTDLTLRDRRNVAIRLLQSPVIALFLLLLASAGALVGSELEFRTQRFEAQGLLFTLAVVGIWFGVINASSELVKERDVYRRERLSNLAIFPYLLSKVTVLGALIVIQNATLLLIIWAGGLRITFPTDTGLLLPAWLEIFLTMMLASLAGMSIGLIISAASKNVDQAMSFVPLVLIPQILFTGVIFQLENPLTNGISHLMISRWAMDAMGTSANVRELCPLPNIYQGNDLKTQCEINVEIEESAMGGQMKAMSPLLRVTANDADFLPFPGAFTYQISYLFLCWGVLLAFVTLGLGATAWLLKRQDRQV